MVINIWSEKINKIIFKTYLKSGFVNSLLLLLRYKISYILIAFYDHKKPFKKYIYITCYN